MIKGHQSFILKRLFSTKKTVCTRNIVNKTSSDWKDLLKGIKKNSGRGTNINT